MLVHIFPQQNLGQKTHLFSQCPRSSSALLLALEALKFETVGAIQFVVLTTAITAKSPRDDIAALRTVDRKKEDTENGLRKASKDNTQVYHSKVAHFTIKNQTAKNLNLHL